jgi:hypothetical protein
MCERGITQSCTGRLVRYYFVRTLIMIQVYKEAFKARATSLRARRVAYDFLLYLHYNLKIITKKVN